MYRCNGFGVRCRLVEPMVLVRLARVAAPNLDGFKSLAIEGSKNPTNLNSDYGVIEDEHDHCTNCGDEDAAKINSGDAGVA